MKICVVSDLHSDYSHPPIQWPDADILVIGGDTSNTIGGTLKLINKVAGRYSSVVIVDGNHEHYSNSPQNRTVEETIEAIRRQLPQNVHLLGHNLPKVSLNGVWFVGCNGWYSFDMAGDPMANRSLWRDFMNDNKWIGFDKILQSPPWDRAEADAALMQSTLDGLDDDQPIVCVTHTAPHRDMVTWKNDNTSWDRCNSFFVNSHMQRVLESPSGQRAAHWINGHTHHCRDRQIGNVHCVANPRGYPRENPHWEPIILEIPLTVR